MRTTRIFILGICSAVTMVGCGSSEGIDARLDATNGYDAHFNASVIKAFEKMSPLQREIFQGTVEELPLEHFLARYGKEPTVKTVANGQLDRRITQAKDEISHLEARANSPGSELQVAKNQIIEANKVMDSISGTVTSIVQKDWDPSHCGKDACIKKYAINIKISNPSSIIFSKLPCTIEVTPHGASIPFTIVENCGGNDIGEYVFEISDKENISFIDSKSKVEFIRSEAKHKKGDLDEFVIPRPPIELQRLEKEQELLATAQAAKTLFK